MNLLDLITDEAIQRADDHANEAWKKLAAMAVEALSLRGRPFTADDLWDEIEVFGVSTHEPRALGAIMRQAVKSGQIRNTGTFVKSRRPECHQRPIAVWEAA